jgi:hypothetical protein
MTNTRDNADHINDVPTIESDIATLQASTATGSNHGRNLIINGDFSVWQRGVSQTTSGYGSDDRWTNLNGGTTKVASQQTFSIGQTDVPNNPEFYARTVVTSVAGVGNFCTKTQNIENVSKTSGSQVTLSFWAKADAAKNIASEFTQNFGTGGSPSSAVTAIEVTTHSLTTAWQKFTVTTTLPSITGKTLGTNDNDSLGLTFWFDAGSNLDGRTNSLGQQSGTFDISNCTLEFGTAATDFEYVSPREQLDNCKRYFERLGGSVLQMLGAGHCETTNGAQISTSYGKKRVDTPTITFSSQTGFGIFKTGANPASTAISSSGDSSVSTLLSVTTAAAALVAGQGCSLFVNASEYLDIDAEL